jgi:hypothetical protein
MNQSNVKALALGADGDEDVTQTAVVPHNSYKTIGCCSTRQ